jgi:two-component system OmpR family sensor kinase
VLWTVWALGCLAAMVLVPGHESIPYHLGWAGFALAFGFGAWTRWQLLTSITWYTLATGFVLAASGSAGDVAWVDSETEIPLMFMLALLMAWQVRRSRTAQVQVMRLAERDVEASRDRERLMRLTSHELRSPLTIARGYVELIQARMSDLENQQDLWVVVDELDRLGRVSDRLIRMMHLQDDRTSETFDIDRVMAQSVQRWQAVTDRRWVLEAGAGDALGSPERMRTCLDTLVENAIRYTSPGDTIRLVGSRQDQQVVVSVLDSGVGLSDQQILAINAGEPSALAATAVLSEVALDTDPLAGTGLGLSIVRDAVRARGGTLLASHAPGGGAALTITFPLDPPVEGEVGQPVASAGGSTMPVKRRHRLTRAPRVPADERPTWSPYTRSDP